VHTAVKYVSHAMLLLITARMITSLSRISIFNFLTHYYIIHIYFCIYTYLYVYIFDRFVLVCTTGLSNHIPTNTFNCYSLNSTYIHY
jgi:hypothetical protein